MTTPFGGGQTPFVIGLYGNREGDPDTSLAASNSGVALTSLAIASLQVGRYIDFSKLTGNFYFEVLWGHSSFANNSTSYFQLYDATAGAALATATGAATAAVGNIGSASTENGFVAFTKPASTAKVYVRAFLGDNTGGGNVFVLWRAAIWVIPS